MEAHLASEDHEFSFVGSLGRFQSFARNTFIWKRGDPVTSLFLLHQGQVLITVRCDRRHDITVRVVRPGELFGLICFDADARRAAHSNARVTEAAKVQVISYPEVCGLLRDKPEGAVAVLAALSERLAYAEERVGIIAQHDAELRLCALLLQIARRTAGATAEVLNVVTIHLPHVELAQLAGLSRPHVTVILGSLRSRGIIRYVRSGPLHIDVPTLIAHLG